MSRSCFVHRSPGSLAPTAVDGHDGNTMHVDGEGSVAAHGVDGDNAGQACWMDSCLGRSGVTSAGVSVAAPYSPTTTPGNDGDREQDGRGAAGEQAEVRPSVDVAPPKRFPLHAGGQPPPRC